MSTSLERAQVLLEQNRPDLARKELLQALPSDPENPRLHVLLAMCFLDGDHVPEAMEHARRAVELAPEWSLSFRTLARVQLKGGDSKLALETARRAVELDPEDEDNHVVLAQVFLAGGRWQEGLDAADTALSLDPEDSDALNMRGLALVKLGRQSDSEATIRTSLSRDPENGITHANMGWALLHAGRAKEAMGHFREALRIDPDQKWAREGLVEAMKARNPVYSVLLRYFLWLGRFPLRTRFALVIGALILVQVVSGFASRNQALVPLADVILCCYMGLVFMTWFASDLFNLLLSIDREGRYALSRGQLVESRIFGTGILLSMCITGYLFSLVESFNVNVLVLPFLWLFPLALTLHAREGLPRRMMVVYTAVVLAALGVAMVAAAKVLSVYLWMSVAATWFSGFIPRSSE